MQNLFIARLVRLTKEDDGPTAVEYAIMMSLIVIVIIAAVKNLAHKTADTFDYSAAAIQEAMNE